MKKRIALFLCVLMLFTMLPQSLKPRAAAPGGRIEGIDYSRIEENELLEHPVTLGIGSVTFDKATLVNGNTLTKDEVDDIIREVMASFEAIASDGSTMPMTSGRLYYYEDVIERSKSIKGDYIKGFDAVSLILLAGKALGVDLLGSWFDIGKFVASKVVDALLSLYSPAALISEIASTAENVDTAMMVSTELFKMYQDNLLAQEAVLYTALLHNFYGTCNAKIQEAEMKSGEASWKLKCNQMVWKDVTVFGSKATQWWKMTCDLERDFDYGGGQAADWSGRYRGTMMIEIWHDLEALDQSFLNSIFLSSELPYQISAQVFKYRDESVLGSRLQKQLINYEFEIHIDRRNSTSGFFLQHFQLDGFRDISEFYLHHPIFGGLNVGPLNENGEWTWHIGGYSGGAEINVLHSMIGGMTGDNKGVQIIAQKWEFRNDVWARIPLGGFHLNEDETQSSGAPLMTDYNVFSDLRKGGAIEMTFSK